MKNVIPSVRTLQKLYDISPYELEKLRKLFNYHAGIDRRLNFQEFIKLYGVLNPQFRGPQIINIAENAFISNDLDNDGLIKFEEFLVAYCLSRPMATIACQDQHPAICEEVYEEVCTPF
jgi:Ca2+-binding EF-hand superfamily protein